MVAPLPVGIWRVRKLPFTLTNADESAVMEIGVLFARSSVHTHHPTSLSTHDFRQTPLPQALPFFVSIICRCDGAVV